MVISGYKQQRLYNDSDGEDDLSKAQGDSTNEKDLRLSAFSHSLLGKYTEEYRIV